MIEHNINGWLLDALDDPKSCDKFRKDIIDWLDICNNNVLLPSEEYQELLDNWYLLKCLRDEGVDCWDGWDMAINKYNGDE